MKKILIIILLSLVFPSIIFASSFTVSIDCPNGNIGEAVSCKIMANVDDNIKNISANITFDGLTNASFTKNSKLNYTKAEANSFTISEEVSLKSKTNSSNFEIGTLNVTIPSSATSDSTYKVTIKDVTGVDINGENVSSSNDVSTISIKSNDNSLKSLTVGKYDLVPAFNSDILSYKVMADDIAIINVSAVANNSNATITGTGDVSLKYGDNTIKVVVKSETGESRTYKIVINRFDSRDKVNTLNNLVVLGYDLDTEFEPNKTTYNVTVESNITKVKITSERTNALDADKPKSTYVKKYGNREVKLNYGLNKVQIKVRAENEVVKTYTINITRIDDRDPNNYLKTLELSSGNYKFDKERTSYIINVENNVSVISIKALAESDKAKVNTVSKIDLKEGSNKITITVTAENETKREYNITINRLKEGTTVEEVENITYFKHLKILNRKFVFNQKTTEYEIEITKEKELTFDYELFDGVTGTIELKDSTTGPIKLSSQKSEITMGPIIDGSVIVLNLTSEEGYTRQFTFNIKLADYYIGDIDIPTEKEKIEIKWTWQLIVGLVSVVIILAEIGYAIYYAIKNGGVENKSDAVQGSISGELKKIKVPKKIAFPKFKKDKTKK